MEPRGLMHHLFRYRAIRRNSTIMLFCWFGFAMGYYGLMYNTPPFKANIYVVFIVPALIDIPLQLIQPYIENRFGRKPMMTFPLLIAGILLLTTMALSNGDVISNKWAIIILAWVGTCCCGFSLSLGYLFTMELYPTLYRTTALSMASAGGKSGGPRIAPNCNARCSASCYSVGNLWCYSFGSWDCKYFIVA